MLKYRLAAAALKAFSLNGLTRYAYRKLGNVVGGRQRAQGIPAHYIDRANGNLAFIEAHGAIRPGMRVLELGTGWVHWEALFTRLFYDVEIVLFDVWDNRQFAGFRRHASALRSALPTLSNRDAASREAAARLLERVLECSDFPEVYRLLGWQYITHPAGNLGAVDANSIDLVISSDVMEHIPAEGLPGLIADFARLMATGGHVSQQIVEADHLCIYDPSAHPKNYLRYTDTQWRRWFENSVQYINRWQHGDFVKLFEDRGFTIVAEEIVSSVDAGEIHLAPRWQSYDKRDLDATVTRLLAAAPRG